ncbi:MAG: hypothetical protein ABJO67_02400 [Pseudoruegeria sp.]
MIFSPSNEATTTVDKLFYNSILPDLKKICTFGFIILLDFNSTSQRVKYTELPRHWEDTYLSKRLRLTDPWLIWALKNNGSIRLSKIDYFSNHFKAECEHAKLKFGSVISLHRQKRRSVIVAAHLERNFVISEVEHLSHTLDMLHTSLFNPSPISKKEAQLLSLLAGGNTILEASKALEISRATANSALATVKHSLRAKTTVQAIAIAVREGFIK